MAGTQRAFERGGLEGQLLVQHLRSAFFTAGSTKPDFVCDLHTDPTMLEVIFFFQQLADGSYAPMPSSEGFFVVPGAPRSARPARSTRSLKAALKARAAAAADGGAE